MQVEVAFALPDRQFLKALDVPAGTTALQAVEASGVLDEFPEAKGLPAGLGVFGRRVRPEQVLVEGDRVEVYRALLVDPKESRRRRAEARKARQGKT